KWHVPGTCVVQGNLAGAGLFRAVEGRGTLDTVVCNHLRQFGKFVNAEQQVEPVKELVPVFREYAAAYECQKVLAVLPAVPLVDAGVDPVYCFLADRASNNAKEVRILLVVGGGV